MNELTVEASVENLENVLVFINRELEGVGCNMKTQMQIDIAVEEIFVNIAHYAYVSEIGSVELCIEIIEEPLSAVITFSDNGIPYNPLEKADPDVTLSAEERNIGGLGIYMVKKSMDGMEYKYKDGKNILCIKKIL